LTYSLSFTLRVWAQISRALKTLLEVGFWNPQ
jgi:hypothetical protein